MNPLGYIFRTRISEKNTHSSSLNNLCQPVPCHPEATANKLAQIWNVMNLSSAKTLGQARACANDWFKVNAKSLHAFH